MREKVSRDTFTKVLRRENSIATLLYDTSVEIVDGEEQDVTIWRYHATRQEFGRTVFVHKRWEVVEHYFLERSEARPTTKLVESGYADERGVFYEVTPMSFDDVKNALGRISVISQRDGKLRNVKINGQCKLWRTRPKNLRLPWKYGMREYGYIEFAEGFQIDGPVPVHASCVGKR